jgi:hypothetical protein
MDGVGRLGILIKSDFSRVRKAKKKTCRFGKSSGGGI